MGKIIGRSGGTLDFKVYAYNTDTWSLSASDNIIISEYDEEEGTPSCTNTATGKGNTTLPLYISSAETFVINQYDIDLEVTSGQCSGYSANTAHIYQYPQEFFINYDTVNNHAFLKSESMDANGNYKAEYVLKCVDINTVQDIQSIQFSCFTENNDISAVTINDELQVLGTSTLSVFPLSDPKLVNYSGACTFYEKVTEEPSEFIIGLLPNNTEDFSSQVQIKYPIEIVFSGGKRKLTLTCDFSNLNLSQSNDNNSEQQEETPEQEG